MWFFFVACACFAALLYFYFACSYITQVQHLVRRCRKICVCACRCLLRESVHMTSDFCCAASCLVQVQFSCCFTALVGLPMASLLGYSFVSLAVHLKGLPR